MLIKFDTKENEARVLKRGVKTLQEIKPNIVFESTADSDERVQLFGFLKTHGLGPYSLTLTGSAAVCGINAINMIDGLSEHSGPLVVRAFFWLSGMAYYSSHADVLALSVVLLTAICILLAFKYRFSWNKRTRIFLDYSSACLLGLMIAVPLLMASKELCKDGTQVLTLVTALWLLIIRLVDIAGVIWPRSRGSKWSVDGDRELLHYRLIDCVDTTEEVVKNVLLLCLMLGGLGVFFCYIGVIESWPFVAFGAVSLGYFVVTNRLSQKT